MMQSLKKNWLVVSNMHEEFGGFEPNYPKVWKFLFDGLFLSKVYKQGLSYKNKKELFFMTLNSDTKFE